MTPGRPSLLRLVLVPSLVTLAVSVARVACELAGIVNARSGGAASPLGITWLVVVFGAWFGWRLAREGEAPGRRFAWAWSLVAVILLVAMVGVRLGGLDPEDRSESAYVVLRQQVLVVTGVAVVLAFLQVRVWSRLAVVLFVYGIGARLTVAAIAIAAKLGGQDTHYTKFGPAGIERDLGDTIKSVLLSQLGFWVGFTVVVGSLAGNVAAAIVRRGRSRS
ncbi:MAG: hypothetical protein HZB39_20895 [Planctomycetes bacterium]|nr:hypothetical protein [Planctomycetota bacterium]